jgi:hypothetical protein
LNRPKARLLIALAAFCIVAGAATSAYAHPTYAQSCSDCHGANSAVKVAVSQTANNGTSATYHVTVSGGSGSAGWGVLEGSTTRSHASNAASNFTVAVGHTYQVWGVKTNTGANHITVSPTGTPPAPPVVPTGTITIGSSLASVTLPQPFVLSGVLGGGSIGDPVVVQVIRPNSPRWSYSSARLVYKTGGAWWYRYTPKLRGTYRFKASFAGTTTVPACVSPVIAVGVR